MRSCKKRVGFRKSMVDSRQAQGRSGMDRKRVAVWVTLLVSLHGVVHAVTTIDVSSTVVTPSVKHMGINLGALNARDTGQIMKELVFQNPSFEGEIYQSVMRCASGTATSCTDDTPYTMPP